MQYMQFLHFTLKAIVLFGYGNININSVANPICYRIQINVKMTKQNIKTDCGGARSEARRIKSKRPQKFNFKYRKNRQTLIKSRFVIFSFVKRNFLQ